MQNTYSHDITWPLLKNSHRKVPYHNVQNYLEIQEKKIEIMVYEGTNKTKKK